MQEGNKIRINCMKMSPPLIRFTFCSKSTRSSTWMVVLVLLLLLCRYWMILNLTKVPMTNESPVVEVELHMYTYHTEFEFGKSFFPRLCERELILQPEAGSHNLWLQLLLNNVNICLSDCAYLMVLPGTLLSCNLHWVLDTMWSCRHGKCSCFWDCTASSPVLHPLVSFFLFYISGIPLWEKRARARDSSEWEREGER